MTFADLINIVNDNKDNINSCMDQYSTENKEFIDELLRKTIPITSSIEYNDASFSNLDYGGKKVFLNFLIFLETHHEFGDCRYFLYTTIQNNNFDEQLKARVNVLDWIQRLDLDNFTTDEKTQKLLDLCSNSLDLETNIHSDVNELLLALIICYYIKIIKDTTIVNGQIALNQEILIYLANKINDYNFLAANQDEIMSAGMNHGLSRDRLIRKIHQQNQYFLTHR